MAKEKAAYSNAHINAAAIMEVCEESDLTTLAFVEAIARAKADNARLKADREWLKARIVEEDERLAHA